MLKFLHERRNYSYQPNKRAGPNKHVGWKIGQNQIRNHVGLYNHVGWKNAEHFNNSEG